MKRLANCPSRIHHQLCAPRFNNSVTALSPLWRPFAKPLETSSRLFSHTASLSSDVGGSSEQLPQHAAIIPRHVSAATWIPKGWHERLHGLPEIARLVVPDEVEAVQHFVNDRSVRELLPQSNVREGPQSWRLGRCSITEQGNALDQAKRLWAKLFSTNLPTVHQLSPLAANIAEGLLQKPHGLGKIVWKRSFFSERVVSHGQKGNGLARLVPPLQERSMRSTASLLQASRRWSGTQR